MKNFAPLMVLALGITLANAAAASEKKPDQLSKSYLLAPGDVISITGKSGQSSEVEITANGLISNSFGPPIKAVGRTPNDVRELLNELAYRHGNSVALSVTLIKPRLSDFTVCGAVFRPGKYQFDTRTACVTGESLIRILDIAGGIRRDGDATKIELTKTGQRPQVVDLSQALNIDDVAKDFVVHVGDMVFVPKLASEKKEESRSIRLPFDRPRSDQLKRIEEGSQYSNLNEVHEFLDGKRDVLNGYDKAQLFRK